jgi:hypothetical protein
MRERARQAGSAARSSAVRAADPVIDSSRLYSCSGAATPFGVARATSVPAAVRIWYGLMSSSAQKPAGSVLPSFMVHFAAPVSAISTVVIVTLPQLPRTVLSVRDQACRRDDLRVQDQSGLAVIPFRHDPASPLPRSER